MSDEARFFKLASNARSAKAKGTEDLLADSLGELAALALHGASPAVRKHAALIVEDMAFDELMARRETARLDAACDGLAVATATGRLGSMNAALLELETLAGEAVSPENCAAARRAIDRHFGTFAPMTSRA